MVTEPLNITFLHNIGKKERGDVCVCVWCICKCVCTCVCLCLNDIQMPNAPMNCSTEAWKKNYRILGDRALKWN